MLTTLTVQHFVLIDALTLTFDKGLSVFTGETGAGKSILLDALSLVLGARAEARFLQKGENTATVSATFSLPKNHPAFLVLKEHGFDIEEDLILRRTLSKDGKTKAFICDQPVSIALLKAVGDTLVEIHGQFASYALLDPATHLQTLDTYGQLDKKAAEVAHAWHNYQKALEETTLFQQNLEQQLAEEAFLRDDMEALDKLDPQPNEEATLIQRRTALMNAERIIEELKNACTLLTDEEQGALTLLARIDSQLSGADKLTEGRFENELKTLSEAQNSLADLSQTLEHDLNDLGDTSELPEIDDRLFALRDMARKYRISIDELPKFREETRQKLKLASNGVEQLASLQKQVEKSKQIYLEQAKELSQLRHQAAHTLDKAVNLELPDLKLEKATFHVQLQDLPTSEMGATGIDRVVFMAATNKGTEAAPIHKCASGGELARFMLALKVNLAHESYKTLVFDEIDTGISGATASAVGERLARLAEHHQTLVITHSAQVAACAKHHYLVQKADTEETTKTSVHKLDKSGRLEEIARLVSGAKITDKSRAVAKELLKN